MGGGDCNLVFAFVADRPGRNTELVVQSFVSNAQAHGCAQLVWKEFQMSHVINVAFRAEWECPVNVRDGPIRDRLILGPRVALKYLQDDFTLRSGHAYWAAVGACTSALIGRGNLEDARSRFIIAYAEHMVRVHS